MARYKLYAGLGGGFGGANYYETVEADSEEEAMSMARELAFEEYESYGGYHGLYTWDSMREEIADNEYDGNIEQVDPADVEIAYTEEVESWISYYVKEVGENDEEEEEEEEGW